MEWQRGKAERKIFTVYCTSTVYKYNKLITSYFTARLRKKYLQPPTYSITGFLRLSLL